MSRKSKNWPSIPIDVTSCDISPNFAPDPKRYRPRQHLTPSYYQSSSDSSSSITVLYSWLIIMSTVMYSWLMIDSCIIVRWETFKLCCSNDLYFYIWKLWTMISDYFSICIICITWVSYFWSKIICILMHTALLPGWTIPASVPLFPWLKKHLQIMSLRQGSLQCERMCGVLFSSLEDLLRF